MVDIELTPTILSKLESTMLADDPYKGICQQYAVHQSRGVEAQGHTGCHSSMSENKKNLAVGTRFKRREINGKQEYEFFEWLVDPKESVYRSLINYLGKDFHVVRNEKGKPEGCYTTNMNVNLLLLTNFFKASRDPVEHPSCWEFWKKWAVERGKNPRLAFILSHFFNEEGVCRGVSHSCLDTYLYDEGGRSKVAVNIEPAFVLNPKSWDFTRHPAYATSSYRGENDEAWKGTFRVFGGDMPVTGYVKPKYGKTCFYNKYFDKPPRLDNKSDAELAYAFDELEKKYA